MSGVSPVLSRLHIHPSRLASAPRAHIETATSDITRVQIDGLVCGVCASRTRAAFEAIPGVRSAHVDLEHGTALIECDRDVHTIKDSDLDSALHSVVVGMWARHLIERSLHLLASSAIRIRGEYGHAIKSSTRKGRA